MKPTAQTFAVKTRGICPWVGVGAQNAPVGNMYKGALCFPIYTNGTSQRRQSLSVFHPAGAGHDARRWALHTTISPCSPLYLFAVACRVLVFMTIVPTVDRDGAPLVVDDDNFVTLRLSLAALDQRAVGGTLTPATNAAKKWPNQTHATARRVEAIITAAEKVNAYAACESAFAGPGRAASVAASQARVLRAVLRLRKRSAVRQRFSVCVGSQWPSRILACTDAWMAAGCVVMTPACASASGL